MMLIGKEFNNQYADVTFVKLVNEKSIHNGLYFGEGFNICTEKITFDKSEGMYFCKNEDLTQWMNHNNKQMTYVFDVTIPDDAKVLIEENRMKCDMFILSNKRLI